MANSLDPNQNNSGNDLQLKLQPVKSSILAGYSYDPKSYILTVAFNNGSQHQYFNVFPPVVSAVFDQGGSVGSKLINQVVKAGYPSKRLV